MRPGCAVQVDAFDCIGKPMLEPATGAIQTETKCAKGATEGTSRLPLLGL